jgi:hypothetical protein
MLKVFCFQITVTGLDRPNIGKGGDDYDYGGGGDGGGGGGGGDRVSDGGSGNDNESLEFIITSYSGSEEVTFQHKDYQS